jgi:pimeloyl-ACP methyl ester carboxylesterase
MPNLVILPATEPDDTTYGTAPMHIEAYPDAVVHQIRFPKMVWYNETVCKETIAQIEALGLSEIVLVGFSKSGLGAWHIARAMPERVAGTIIFDSPVVRYQ